MTSFTSNTRGFPAPASSSPTKVTCPTVPPSPYASSTGFSEINWDIFSRSGTLTSSETQILRMAETNPLTYVLIDPTDSKTYVNALVQTLGIESSNEVRHYVLSRILEVLSCEVKGVENLFWEGGEVKGSSILLRCVQSSDGWSVKASSCILSHLLTTSSTPSTPALKELIKTIFTMLSNEPSTLPRVITALTVVVKGEDGRKECLEQGGVGCLGRFLRGGEAGGQTTYEVVFVLWCMSFESNLDSFRVSQTVPLLHQILTTSNRDKITRVTIATLKNLTSSPPLVSEMSSLNLLKRVNNLLSSPQSDPDVLSDLSTLKTLLEKSYQNLTTWDVYVSELKSGILEWGAVHTERFWRENSKNMEDNDFEILKILNRLLVSGSTQTIAIACYDIGEFSRFYPGGRGLVKKMGGKDRVMELIESEDEEVGRQALVAVSKVMVQNWEFVK
ncbi:hypothetical protein TrVE_jg7386 [Triparma verrucosa]|uniref:ATPase V1 complex subunit H C-terminal domain-containing protein n=1 Tax=Triparma verrucosa TaxID=1606542 RepID=A0A9W7CHZ5_9STRA|nr:hypothetical protein TrVE_jg7386 [Triparma verrucosa]